MRFTPAHLGVLQIEPTDHCNLACKMCAPHAEAWSTVHGVPKGFLSMDTYSAVLDGLVRDGCRFDHVIFQWLGDPSLHPRFDELVTLAAARLGDRVGYLRFDTNALQLGPARAEALLRGVGTVPVVAVFTLDAVRPETYLVTKGRDALDVATRHVRAFLDLRRRLGRTAVSVQVQFVVQPTNWFEAGDFVRHWEAVFACHGDGGFNEIQLKRLSVGGGAAGQAAADALYERTLARYRLAPRDSSPALRTWAERPWQQDDAHGGRGPCPGLWYTPVVRHDGHLLACCSDLRGELDLGSLRDAGFLELWQGPRARALREAHLAGRFEGVCASCGGINWYGLDPVQVARLAAPPPMPA